MGRLTIQRPDGRVKLTAGKTAEREQNMTLTTSAWKVRSTHRKSGKTQVLDPNFLNRAAAMTFLERLEAKYGGWYSYEAVDLEAEAAWNALGEPEDAPGATQSLDVEESCDETDSVRYRPSQAQQAEWDREAREADRKAAAHFAGRDLDAPAKPDDGYSIAEDGKCLRCAGTGQFITMVENGVPKGPGGTCFRCAGKGWQTVRDARRNDYWERHRTVHI